MRRPHPVCIIAVAGREREEWCLASCSPLVVPLEEEEEEEGKM